MKRHDTLPAAILWDMDGTMIDTEPYWIAAELDLCGKHGVEWSHADGLQLVGGTLVSAAQILIERGLKLPVPEIVDTLLGSVVAKTRAVVPWQPDAVALLDRFAAEGRMQAIVTGSYPSLAAAVTDVRPGFEVVVTGLDIANGKPHPDSYLLAAERLGVDVRDCLALEDSPAGTASAYASEARTVAVHRLVALEPREGMSRVKSLDSLTPDAVAHVMAGGVIDEFLSEELPVG